MPATIHKKRIIKALADKGKSLQAIGKRVGIPRGEVQLVIDSMHTEGRRFSCPELAGIPQLTDDEADLAAMDGKLKPFDEAYLSVRVWSIASEISGFRTETMRGQVCA